MAHVNVYNVWLEVIYQIQRDSVFSASPPGVSGNKETWPLTFCFGNKRTKGK